MTQQEWDNTTEEERDAEIERCHNPVYFYNTYWVDKDGNHPKPITQEYWDQLIQYAEQYERNRYSLKRIYRQPSYEKETNSIK